MGISSFHEGVWYSILQRQSLSIRSNVEATHRAVTEVMTTQILKNFPKNLSGNFTTQPAEDVAVAPTIIAATGSIRGLPAVPTRRSQRSRKPPNRLNL
ncbi:hypothetical protein RRG08_014992 [Elysia crispata]|uniref:Uncharacterized protein n=1 Tax=Elysia crispata TaxID=231223 RepID=A0AAE1CQ83_9GAST|nr:hypothetical protein RRG08_014992 [Elysia crispata]